LGGFTDVKALSDLIIGAYGIEQEDFLINEGATLTKEFQPHVGLE